MKKLIIAIVTLSLFVFASGDGNHTGHNHEMKQEKKMKNFRAVPVEEAELLQEGEGKNFGPVCGMTLNNFYKTNHAATYNGKELQFCSIHCMVEDIEVNGKKLTNFRAVDNVTLKFMDSNKLFFVVGSKKPGTMSVVSKYAFSKKELAQKFVKENGGKIMSFKEVYALTKDRLKGDIEATKKRQAKGAKMGKKIYEKMCKQTEKRFKSPNIAKTFLSTEKLCGNLKGKKLQQVALYLSGRGN